MYTLPEYSSNSMAPKKRYHANTFSPDLRIKIYDISIYF